LALLALLAARPTLALAPLILSLLEGLVAKLLLLANHVAELVERRHHVVAVVAVHVLSGPRHLQVLEDRLQLLEQPLGGVLGAGLVELLDPVEHVLEVLRPDLARIGVERPGELLRILAHLLGHGLHEPVERRAKLIGQALDLLLARAPLQSLTERFLRGAQLRLGVGDVAVLDLDRHRPEATHDFAQVVVALGVRELIEDRTQAEIDARFWNELLRRDRHGVERLQQLAPRFRVERQYAPELDQRARQRLDERALRQRELEGA